MKVSKAISPLLALILLLSIIAACTNDEEASDVIYETLIIQMEDVSPDDWFYRYVVAGLRFGLITAESGESFRFEPDRDVTQGEFITMLGRLHEYGHGVIGAHGEDVTYYERYVAWALEMGIVHRYRYWELMPDSPINREQKVVMLYQYLNIFDLWDYVRFEHGTLTEAFRDYSEISYWARRPVEIFRSDFMIFRRDGYFEPYTAVTRAEALAMMTQIGNALYDQRYPITLQQ